MIKSLSEQRLMTKAGETLSWVMNKLELEVKPGVSGSQLDGIAKDLILSRGCKPAFLGYGGFPSTICLSINDEIVHGIPTENRVLKNSDLCSIDIGLSLMGYHADMARTFMVGEVSKEDKRLVEVTKEALSLGVENSTVGNTLGDVGYAIQSFVEERGFSVVREYTGHGIGRSLHEPPQILNYGKKGDGMKIQEGMVFAIEPMVNAGDWTTRLGGDGWTVLTKDGSKSAHFEDTILITNSQPKVLTLY